MEKTNKQQIMVQLQNLLNNKKIENKEEKKKPLENKLI